MSQIEHADFTPSAPNFKQLVLMNFQGLTNFPFIEEDFDALTNYGLLSKVVEYLNQVISNNNEQNDLMTALYNAYVSLQDYVNTYFDSLDVQEEINNKLDDMAESGELTNIIKNYVDPIYQAYENEIDTELSNYKTFVNNEITQLSNKVNSATNKNPIPVSSVSSMTDTSKIYVLTTDGYWYYHNGTTWVQGGVYQSTSIETDKTLSQTNVPADSKATGDKFKELDLIFALEQGSLNASSGIPTSSNARVRTNFMTFKSDIILQASEGYTFALFIYNSSDDSFINYLNYSTRRFIEYDTSKKYKVVIKNDSETAITPTYTNSYMTIYDATNKYNYPLQLGGFTPQGLPNTSNSRCRTDFLTFTNDMRISAKDGYQVLLLTYNISDDSLVSMTNYEDMIQVPYDNIKKYRLAIKNSTNTYFIPTMTDDYLVIEEFNIYDINVLKKVTYNGAKGIFCIMQYNNGQWYNGSGQVVPADKLDYYKQLQSNIIGRYQPDILCMEEVVNTFGSTETSVDFLSQFYENNVIARGGSTYHGKSISSNMQIIDPVNINYTSGYARNYEKCYMYLNGLKVCVIATHFSLDTEESESEITELLTAIQNEEYVIICMDANLSGDSEQMARFTNAGYQLVNDGSLITHVGVNDSIDNIVVSSNFTISHTIVDKQKENNPDGSDHYPLITYLSIH